LYAASKLAGEGLITAYCEGFDFQSWIFRFVSVLGARYTHGHVFDFCQKLRDNPNRLEILGNGLQTKAYMDVSDCISAILAIVEKSNDKVNIFNFGTGEACIVNNSVGWICERLGVTPELSYTGGDRGWIGDNPLIHLDPSRLKALGWAPRYDIQQSVERTVDWLMANSWAMDARK
jgi:UDP-glucose 4-epimerase